MLDINIVRNENDNVWEVWYRCNHCHAQDMDLFRSYKNAAKYVPQCSKCRQPTKEPIPLAKLRTC